MRGTIKKVVVFMIAVAMTIFVAVSMASAFGWHHDYNIQGEYAFTGTGTCLVAPFGFNGMTPNPAPAGPFAGTPIWIMQTSSWEGTFVFERNGEGDVSAVIHSMTSPNGTTLTVPSAGIAEISWEFTYTVAKDGEITFTTKPDSYLGCSPSCQTEGHTEFKLNSGPQKGVITEDGRTILVTCGAPVKIKQPPTAPADNMICNVSFVLSRIED